MSFALIKLFLEIEIVINQLQLFSLKYLKRKYCLSHLGGQVLRRPKSKTSWIF